jgi:hypothetical protein
MRYPDAKRFEGMIMWAGSVTGPKAVPGKYKVRLTVGKETKEEEFEILKDPRVDASIEDMQEQFNFLISVRDKLSETHQTITDIRTIRKQLSNFKDLWKDDNNMKPLIEKANDMEKSIGEIENELYQTKNRSSQDPLNFPIKLNNKLAHVGMITNQGDNRPTKQAYQVRDEMTKKIDDQLVKYRKVRDEQLPAFNRLVKDKGVDAIILKEIKKTVQ